MIVKVCGITQPKQYKALASLGVDMLGLNYYPNSKRYVGDYVIDNSLPKVMSVGVFVNPSKNYIYTRIADNDLDYVQLHGTEEPEFCAELSGSTRIIKAFGIENKHSFNDIERYESLVEYFLFDTKTKTFGGSGKKFDWSLLNAYTGNTPFLLSGGIAPNDIDRILKIEHPMLAGIDVNSGFEISPGIKDLRLIEELMKKISK